MKGISVTTKGCDFKRINNRLERLKHVFRSGLLDKYGKLGVEALAKATPKDTGLTSESWSYKVKYSSNSATLEFHNDNIQDGVNVALILYYGHVTESGYWVRGVDYIDPALTPVFESMAKNAIKEATIDE